MVPVLKLLVLKTPQAEKVKEFYECLGISFAVEKHGQGPVHFAAEVGEMVLEIYPRRPEDRLADSSPRLGFKITEPEVVRNALAAFGTPVSIPAAPTSWGCRAVVQDPDGRKVELYWD